MSENVPTNQQIVDNANILAAKFYSSLGYQVEKGYRFDQAKHPQEQQMWDFACISFDLIQGTDVEDALQQLQDESV